MFSQGSPGCPKIKQCEGSQHNSVPLCRSSSELFFPWRWKVSENAKTQTSSSFSPAWGGFRNLKQLAFTRSWSPQASWGAEHLLGASQHLLLTSQPHLQSFQLLVLLLTTIFCLLALCWHLNPETSALLKFKECLPPINWVECRVVNFVLGLGMLEVE